MINQENSTKYSTRLYCDIRLVELAREACYTDEGLLELNAWLNVLLERLELADTAQQAISLL